MKGVPSFCVRFGGRVSGPEFYAALTALGTALPYGDGIALRALRAFEPLDELPISHRLDTGLSRLHWP